MNITEIKQETHQVDEKKLDKYISAMKSNGIKNPVDMLPKSKWHSLSFLLTDTYSSMANAIRRVLMEELLVTCLTIDEFTIETDDEFIVSDVLKKNINLLPCNQTYNTSSKSLSLYKYNKTNKVIDVKAKDLSNKDVVSDLNITICQLRPGKYVKIKNITFEQGYAKDNAAKFSLLDNITYEIVGVEPYDIFKDTGKRSIEYDPTKFRISFTTTGNISIKQTIDLLHDTLIHKLTRARDYLTEYSKTDQNQKYYYVDGFEVTLTEDIYIYKFHNEYVTLANMLAQQCYLLDKNILYCVPSVDRYDNEFAYIKLKHADATKLLINACDECIKDVNKLTSTLKK